MGLLEKRPVRGAARWWLLAAPLAITLGATAPLWAGDDKDERKVRGEIVVDVPGNAVTVAGTRILVVPETEIEIDDKPATLQQLADEVGGQPGRIAEVEYQIRSAVNEAEKIELEDDDDNKEDENEVEGLLTVQVEAGTVTVGGVVLVVDGDTHLEADDDTVDLSGLAAFVAANPGTEAEAHFRLDGETRVATRVETDGDSKDDGDEDSEDEHELRGPLSLDLVNSTVTVGGVVVLLQPGTEVEILDRDATLTALAEYLAQNPGAHGKVEYRVINDQLLAREIEIDSKDETGEVEATGEVQSIDLRTSSLVFAGRTGSPITLTVPVGAEIEINDAEVTLAELVGILPVTAKVHYDPVTLKLRELDVVIPVQTVTGQVRAVAGTSGLTISTQVTAPGRRAAKFRVLKGATIIKAGGLVRTRNLRKGDRVRVSFYTARNKLVSPEVVAQ